MLNLKELTKNNQSMATLDWELLVANAIGKTREYFFSHPEYVPTIIERTKLWRTTGLYKKGWPIAYILGHKEFFGLDFIVNRHTLIPRPETELMVEAALDIIARNEAAKQYHDIQKELLLIDIGTGSGCIPISIAKKMDLSNLKIFATDISTDALRVAKKNAKKHDVKIIFLHGNLLEPISKRSALYVTDYTNIIITANLPYLTAEQFVNEPSIQREPKSALVADNQGLALYEKLLKQIDLLISNIHYPNISIFLEIDPSQSSQIKKIINKLLPSAAVEIKTDLAGRDRLVIVRINS